MNAATTKTMILLAQKNDEKINAFVPKELRDLMQRMATKKKMNEPSYIRVALINQIESDLSELQTQ